MTVCKTNNLYDGIIYVHNKALNDFLTPFEVYDNIEQLSYLIGNV